MGAETPLLYEKVGDRVIIKQNLTTVNFRKGRAGYKPQYIVIHNTANNGDTDEGNAKYFHDNKLNASAHYFVDEDSVTQVVKDGDTSWHCADKQPAVFGGGSFKGKCLNSNSIGVELCSDIVGGELVITEQTQNNGAELTATLMIKYGIPIEHVIRHFDVTYKQCPRQFARHSEAWEKFRLKVLWWAIKWKFNLTSDESNYIRQYKFGKELMTGLLAEKKDFSAETMKYLYSYKYWESLREKLVL
jgi:N-acetylmuramoyl-L-alanine amidase CwlA